MGLKKCIACGKEKTFDNFYVRSEKRGVYDETDPRLYKGTCKECHLQQCKDRRENKLSYTHGLYFVYFIYNYDNELIYIGKTNDLYGRMKQHQKENRLNESDINYIDFELMKSAGDAFVREIYYINKYKPILNKRDLVDEEIQITVINELEKYRVYRNDIEQFKHNVIQIIEGYLTDITIA